MSRKIIIHFAQVNNLITKMQFGHLRFRTNDSTGGIDNYINCYCEQCAFVLLLAGPDLVLGLETAAGLWNWVFET